MVYAFHGGIRTFCLLLASGLLVSPKAVRQVLLQAGGLLVYEDLQESLVSDDYTFLGIHFTHQSKSVAVGGTALARLQPLRLEDSVQEALCSFEKGIAVPHSRSHVLFCCVKVLLDAKAEVWPCILEPWNAWIALRKRSPNLGGASSILEPGRGINLHRRIPLTLGMSASKQRPGPHRWRPQSKSLHFLHITSLELLAVALTVSALNLKDAQLNILIDNQAAQAMCHFFLVRGFQNVHSSSPSGGQPLSSSNLLGKQQGEHR
jgi:hypothetical protein